jgi:uncharacterized protein YdhG (YjbR/CyaY superfamily)
MSEMKTLEEAVVEAIIEGQREILKKIEEIYHTYKELHPAIKTEIQTGINPINEIRNNFSKDLAELLTFEIKEDHAIIRPKQFLGSDNFAKVAAIVRNLGGEYVSAGKNSHFKIQRK